MPRPSRLSTMTGTLNECSSRNSTVSWAPDGFSKTSSALSKKHKETNARLHNYDPERFRLSSQPQSGIYQRVVSKMTPYMG